jgi:hypothetical protein
MAEDVASALLKTQEDFANIAATFQGMTAQLTALGFTKEQAATLIADMFHAAVTQKETT